MAIEQTSISPQFILSGLDANKGTGSFKGQIYYATDTNLNYFWDGTDWIKTSVDLNNVYKLIGNNALNILDLTAQANLTAGINANFERDTYSDANGYLNTLNATNTTAEFNSNKYLNRKLSQQDLTETSHNTNNYLTKKTFTFSPSLGVEKVTNEIRNSHGGGTSNCKIIFIYDDDTTREVEKANYDSNYKVLTYTNTNLTKKVKQILVQIKALSNTVYEKNTMVFILGDTIVETNEQTIDAGFTKFMIVANEETSGTGSVTYDISFDNGTNYQEDLASFTEYTISDAGTSLILKQKLNAGASSGTASAYNWGVLLW